MERHAYLVRDTLMAGDPGKVAGLTNDGLE